MTCSIPGGITLRFLRSDVSIRPYELNLRAKRRNFMHGQVVTSRDAGEKVKRQTYEAEPAVIEFAGNVAHRFYIGPDAVEFYFDHGDRPRARIDIQDARKVMLRGNIDKQYNRISLIDIVNDLVGAVDDPNNVIEEVRYTGEDVKDDMLNISNDFFDFYQPLNNLSTGVGNWLIRQFQFLQDDPAKVYSGFEFDNTTPLDAMQQAMKEFEHQWWVDESGTLWIGQDGTFGSIAGVVSENNAVSVSRYDVVESSSKVNRVVATSDVANTTNQTGVGPVVSPKVKTRLKAVAVVSAPSVDGATETLGSKKTLTQGELRQTASRYLYEQIMEDTNGSIKINGLASRNKSMVAGIQPGDHFIVADDLEENCARGAVTGHFLVKSISHRATPMQGWKITLNVSQVVPHGALVSQSFFYDPTTDTRYDTLQEVAEEGEGTQPDGFTVP